jgi:hypothetical protein
MKKLRKFTIDELEKESPILTVEEQRQTTGGIFGWSSFETVCLAYYMSGIGGSANLTSSAFGSIADAASNCGSSSGGTWVNIGGAMYEKRTVNMYGCGDYNQALGTCTIYYDQCGNAVGMQDTYDFNINGADREMWYQIQTIVGSMISGSSFKIQYGIHE